MGREKMSTAPALDIPLEEGIVLRRAANGTALTNVPTHVVEHSPTGFEFSYGGSGPADLALNVCEEILRLLGWKGPRVQAWDGRMAFCMAYELHQGFKWELIATVPREGGVIPFSRAVCWVLSALKEKGYV